MANPFRSVFHSAAHPEGLHKENDSRPTARMMSAIDRATASTTSRPGRDPSRAGLPRSCGASERGQDHRDTCRRGHLCAFAHASGVP